MNDFWNNQLESLRQLLGKTIIGITGVEMALREDSGAGSPQFSAPGVPFKQLTQMHFLTESGQRFQLSLLPGGDENFGFSVSESAEIESPGLAESEGSIYRDFQLELPRRLVTQLLIGHDQEGCIMDIVLSADVPFLRLLCGEAVEVGPDLRFNWPEESILLFDRPDQVEQVNWHEKPALTRVALE